MAFPSFPSSGLVTHTLEALLPGLCNRTTHALSLRSRRVGPPMPAGRRTRASGTLVPKRNLGNEGQSEGVFFLPVDLLAKQQSLFTIGIPTNRIVSLRREFVPCPNVNLAPLIDLFLSNAYCPNWFECFTIFRNPTRRWRVQLQSVVVGPDCINRCRSIVVCPAPSKAD